MSPSPLRPAGAPTARCGARLLATVLVTSALVAVPALAGVAPRAQARAPEGAGGGASVDIALTRIAAVVEPDGGLLLRARITNRSRQDRGGLRVVATMHRPTRSRPEYQRAMDRGEVGTIVHAFAAGIGRVPARGARSVELAQSAAQLGLDPVAGREGVYPLRLRLLDGDRLVGEVLTSVVVTAVEVERPLATAVVLTLARPPSRDASGAFTHLGLADDLRPDGRIGEVLDVLAARPRLPLTVATDAHTLEEVADLADGFRLRTAAGPALHDAGSEPARRADDALGTLRAALAQGGTEVVPLPYASADLVALVRGGLRGEATRHLTEAARAVESATGVRPAADVLVPPDGITEDALSHAFGAGVRAVLLSPDEVRMPEITRETPSAVRGLRLGGGPGMTALVADPWLQEALARPAPTAAQAAQRVLGELATIYHELPGRRGRGVVLVLRGDHPAPAGLARALAEGVHAAAPLQPVTLSGLRRTVREEPGRVRLTYPREARQRELPAPYVGALAEARQALGFLDGVLAGDRTTPAAFDQLLLRAASVHYRGPGRLERGRELLATVTATLERLAGTVVVPETPAVTLTSLDGQLPVTVRSTADVRLRVRVRLRTNRLAVEGGPAREIVLEPGETRVLMLPVRALIPGGTAPVDVRVTDADGEMVMASGRVVVRSTAFSVTAVLAVAGAALFLLGWWLRETARRRQRVAPASKRGRRRSSRGHLPPITSDVTISTRGTSAPAGAGSRLAGDESGDVILSGLLKIVTILLVIGVVIFEISAIAVNHVQLDEIAGQAARAGAGVPASQRNAAGVERAILAELEGSGATLDALTVGKDTVIVTVSRDARVLILDRLPPARDMVRAVLVKDAAFR